MKTFKSFINDQTDINEGLLNFLKGGKRKIGDKVHGRKVASDLDKDQPDMHSDRKLDSIRKKRFEVRHIDLDTAKKYRKTTDTHYGGDAIDADKMHAIRKVGMTHDSLMNHLPVVDHTGNILDGNHRVQHAIESGMKKIPVLHAY